MLYVVLGMLNEVRPVWYFVLAMVLFVLSQLDYFLLNKVICKVRRLLLQDFEINIRIDAMPA